MQLYWKDHWGSLNTKYFNSHTLRLGLVKRHLGESPQMEMFCWDLCGSQKPFLALTLPRQCARDGTAPFTALQCPVLMFMLVRTCIFYYFTDYGGSH